MGLSADDFTNNNEKFNAQFAVTDGVLTIEKATKPVVEESKEEPIAEKVAEEVVVEEESAPVMMKSAAPSSEKNVSYYYNRQCGKSIRRHSINRRRCF